MQFKGKNFILTMVLMIGVAFSREAFLKFTKKTVEIEQIEVEEVVYKTKKIKRFIASDESTAQLIPRRKISRNSGDSYSQHRSDSDPIEELAPDEKASDVYSVSENSNIQPIPNRNSSGKSSTSKSITKKSENGAIKSPSQLPGSSTFYNQPPVIPPAKKSDVTTPSSSSGGVSFNVSQISIIEGQVVIKGEDLDRVKKITITGNNTSKTLTKISGSKTNLIFMALLQASLIAGEVYDFIISDANASVTFPVEIVLEDGSVTLDKLEPMTVAEDGYVLKWDNNVGRWVAAPETGGGGGGGSGTLTSVGLGVGIVGSGGSITTTGTIDVDVGFGNDQIPVFDGSGKMIFNNNVLEFDQTNSLVFKQNSEEFSLKMITDKLQLKNEDTTTVLLTVDGDEIHTTSNILLLDNKKICLADGTNCSNSAASYSTIGTTGPQFTVGYNTTEKATITVASNGFTSFASAGTAPGFKFTGGQVGIGSYTPGAELDIRKDSTGDVLTRVWNSDTSGTGKAVLRIANSGNQVQGAQLQFSDLMYYNATIAADRTRGLSFRTGVNQGTETGLSDRMTILPNGNVGIGTSAPAAPLSLVGNFFNISSDQSKRWNTSPQNTHWRFSSDAAEIMSLSDSGVKI
nr:hypothetical protein [Bdellovibrionales bacterium]